jgi:uncharacterized protein GlcG (DUF336 family)
MERQVIRLPVAFVLMVSRNSDHFFREPVMNHQRKFLCILFIVLMLCGAWMVSAQTQMPSYGAPVSLEQAKKVAEAAEAEARKNKWNVVIAIVDTGNNLVLLHRLDDTQVMSIEIAQKKARTANGMRRPSKVFEDLVANGSAGWRILGIDPIIPVEGGLPLIVEGKVIGAIGVSGVTSQQDGQIAAAGTAVLK